MAANFLRRAELLKGRSPGANYRWSDLAVAQNSANKLTILSACKQALQYQLI
jgi:hypothetical protein